MKKVLLLIVSVFSGLACLSTGYWVGGLTQTQAQSGEPLTRIEESVTFVTTPTDSNGDIDYIAAINEQSKSGVNSENNSVVKFCETFIPRLGDRITKKDFYQEIGFEGDRPSLHLFPYESWLVTQKDYRRAGKHTDMQHKFAMSHAWSAEKFAEQGFAEQEKWLEEFKKASEFIREGSTRSHYFCPLVDQTDSRRPMVINCGLNLVVHLQEFAKYFQVHAMHLVSTGDPMAAVDDAECIYRIAALIGQGPTLVEQKAAVELAEKAYRTVVAICSHSELTADQLTKIADRVTAMKPVGDFTNSLNNSGRMMVLDSIVASARSGKQAVPLGVQVNWNETLIVINQWFDSVVQASSIKNPQKRSERYEEMTRDLEKRELNAKDPTAIRESMKDETGMGQMLGEIYLTSMAPHYQLLGESELRSIAGYRITRVIVGAMLHQSKTGEPLESLDDPSEFIDEKLKRDPFSDSTFELTRTDGHLEVNSQGGEFVQLDPFTTQVLTWPEYQKKNSRWGKPKSRR